MDILYLLIPLSVVLVLLVMVGLGGPSTPVNSRRWSKKVNAYCVTIDLHQIGPSR